MQCFAAFEPDRIRGKNIDIVWCEEVGAWDRLAYSYDMVGKCMRQSEKPRKILTMTPPNEMKRVRGAAQGRKFLRELFKRPGVVLTEGSTFDNMDNLPQAYIDAEITPYIGTRQGEIEIYGKLLDIPAGAIFFQDIIDKYRVDRAPELTRIAIGIDPNASDNESSDEMGVIIMGKSRDELGKWHYYIIGDATVRGTPDNRIGAVMRAYDKYGADLLVPEVNNGGDWIGNNIRQFCERAGLAQPAIKPVRASRGKMVRADPMSTAYGQGVIHHVGVFPELEEQLTLFEPNSPESPDRLDAAVWAYTALSQGDSLVAWSS